MKKNDPKNANFPAVAMIVGAVVLAWVLLASLPYYLLPSWESRGQLGDSFGAVNALFSGLAFAGLIYSLNRQRFEFGQQMAELRTSRGLQAQPLVVPTKISAIVERPRLFYTPPEKRHSFNSRNHVAVKLSNKSTFPGLSCNVTGRLLLPESKNYLTTVDEYVAVMPDSSSTSTEESVDFLFGESEKCGFLDSLNQSDPRNVPKLALVIVYKNALGSNFMVEQVFDLFVDSTAISLMHQWHADILGFKGKYSQEFETLIKLKREGSSESWEKCFEELKEKCTRKDEPESFALFASPVPGTFRLSVIEEDEYERQVSTASYAQLIGERYSCPGESH